MSAAEENYDTWEGEEEEDYEENEAQDSIEQDIQIGEEIALSHEEVWDDSALIEAWDAAVKQYELYHNPSGDHAKSRPSTKETQAGSAPKRPQHPAVSSRTGSGAGTNKKPVLTNERKPTSSAKANIPPSTSTLTTATTTSVAAGTRDTSKKTRPSPSKGTGASSKEISGAMPAKKKAKVQHDWTSESGAQTWQWPQATNTTTGAGDTAVFNPYAQFTAPYPHYMPPYPGTSSMAGMHGAGPPPMMPWNMPPPPPPSAPPMFAPPVPPPSMFVPSFLSSGDAGAAHRPAAGPRGMDDESLGNLIMAWYYSGYYTGLYQARRQQQQ
ncbi:hypothetical protein BGZ73_002719 [Actinomortierella ambigua]|nr:hypothetical protein BGZ73_002719 [Actinomortierella ambigua]